jgi:SWI/SNF-related matrix-associated actin-dependent regulator 1 of chromatin subfamily A
MARIIQQGNTFVFECTFAEKDIAKQCGFWWDKDRRWWYAGPRQLERCTPAQLEAAAKYASPEVAAALTGKSAEKVAAVEASRAQDADIEIPCPEGLAFLGYQKAGIAYALARPATLLGDQPGLGKSCQTVGVVNADSSVRTVLVVCPASLKIHWQREWLRWATAKTRVEILGGDTRGAAAGDAHVNVVVCNYEAVKKLTEEQRVQMWDLVVVDEAHAIKSHKAQRTQNTKALKGKRRMLLTGTPISNRPAELWSLLNFLDPVAWPSFFSFGKRYCNAHQTKYGWDFSGAANLEELQERLRSTLMVRRLKEDVLKELPPKRRQIVVLDGTGCKQALAREAKISERLEDLRAQLEIAKAEGDAAYEKAAAELTSAETGTIGEMAHARHMTALAKVPQVVEHVLNATEDDEEHKVVLFAHHKDVCDALAAGLRELNPVTVTGDMDVTARQVSVDCFQGDKTCRVIIGTIGAMGVGLTLTASSHVVMAELDWVPGNVSQAEDRCHRYGAKGSVLVQHLVVDGSIDARLVHVITAKQEVIDRATDRIHKPEPLLFSEQKDGATSGTTKEQVAQLAETVTERQRELTLQGLRIMSAFCDGARGLDGMGFSKIDVRIGKDLAERGSLSPKQTVLGMKILRKYRKTQLPQELSQELFTKEAA